MVFNKRAEWDSKSKAFSKFGTRKRLLDPNEEVLGEAVSLIVNSYQEPLTKIFKDKRYERTVCFFEFFGPSSFAGIHKTGEPHQVVLFDIDVYKKGLLQPREFLKLVEGKVSIPGVLYEGKANSLFVDQVKTSTLPGMTFEGVVCKGLPIKNGYPPLMFKVKSEVWIEKVKSLYPNADKEMLEDLL